MRHGIIFKATDGTTRFIMPSGRMYIWAYGAWRFKAQIHESMYTSIRRIAGRKDSKVFAANSRKVFMDKRVAFDPWDYQYMELCGTNQRMSKVGCSAVTRWQLFSKFRHFRTPPKHDIDS